MRQINFGKAAVVLIVVLKNEQIVLKVKSSRRYEFCLREDLLNLKLNHVGLS